jgi:hypothetical protein
MLIHRWAPPNISEMQRGDPLLSGLKSEGAVVVKRTTTTKDGRRERDSKPQRKKYREKSKRLVSRVLQTF